MEDRLLIGDEIEVQTSDREWHRAVVESISDARFKDEPVRARYKPALPWATHCFLTAGCLSQPVNRVRRALSPATPAPAEGE